MVLTKILKRRDAASIVAAVLVALILTQPIAQVTSHLAGKVSGLKDGQYGYTGPGSSWKDQYLYPVVWAILQLVLLEILAWIVVLANRPMNTTKGK
jgi:hypothetical protein